MKKKTYLFLILLLFIVLPVKVKATCTDSEKNHFNEISDTYTVTYEYDYNQKTYDITFNAPEPNKYGYILEYRVNSVDVIENIYRHHQENYIFRVEPYIYTIKVIGLTSSCNDVLKTINIKLDKKNPYYKDPLCDDIKEFVLCQENYDGDLDYDNFVSRVKVYKNTSSSSTTSSSNKINQNAKIASYIEDNLFQIIIVLVFIVLLIITTIIMVKSYKKSRRLE